MKACLEIRNKLERYIDGELSDQERAAIEAHLSHCTDCARELEILKSIDAIGKSEIFPDPPQDYWQQLRQNIMSQISPPDKKSSRLADILTMLKSMILPAKVSYRLVGLAATAVIVLFIFYFSFVQKGTFELPIVIDETDFIQMTEQKTKSLERPTEITFAEEFPQEKNGAQAVKKKKSLQDKEISQPSTPSAESELKIEPAPDQPNQMVALSESLADGGGKKDFVAPGTAIPAAAESIPVTEKMGRSEITPTVIASHRDRSEINGVQVNKGIPDRLHVKSASLADSSLIQFNNVFRHVKHIENLSEKIQVWEEYVIQKPELEFLKRAKYQQALLYYQLAKEKMTADDMRQALKFYQENAELLFSGATSETVRRQIQELNDLLKKIEKKE